MASSNTATVRLMTETAQDIYKCLTKHFDTDQAKKKLRELYRNGIEILQREFTRTSLLDSDVVPIMLELNKTVALETLHHHFLHRKLCKVYRIFIEIVWIQCYLKGDEQPIWTKTKNRIREDSENILSVLPKRAVEAEFEYACAREAAKCLSPSEAFWFKYISQAAAIAAAIKAMDISDIWIALKPLIQDYKEDWIQGWYLDIQHLRWLATIATTVSAFNKTVSKEEIKACIEQGGHCSVGIVLVFIEIIKNPHAEPALKDLVFHGNQDFCGLKHMIDLEHKHGILDYLKHPTEILRAVARNPDRYWKTRTLAMQQLQRLASKQKYHRYKDESSALLRARLEKLNKKTSAPFQEEKQQMQSMVQILGQQIKELNSREHDLMWGGGFKGSHYKRNPTEASGLSEEEVSQYRASMEARAEKLEEIQKDKQIASNRLKEIEEGLNQVESIAAFSESVEKDERELLQEFFKINP
ncbi:MAG: hypothetical protein JSS10_06925 [Verrucomicrobia bacterium]|nr:hypothetical protein [Verrucomicrobiota bacterium]